MGWSWVYDTEDHHDISGGTGWTGACGAFDLLFNNGFFPHNGYTLRFCKVPLYDNTSQQYNFTSQKNVEYAVLKLTVNRPDKTGVINVFQDNEDDNNINYYFDSGICGSSPSKSCNLKGQDYPSGLTPPPNHFDRNTRLSFIHFPKTTNGSTAFTSLPSIGKNYGVLGTFGSSSGVMYFDDEDDNNINAIDANIYNPSTNTYTNYSSQNGWYQISNLIEQVQGGNKPNGNTKYYMSLVY